MWENEVTYRNLQWNLDLVIWGSFLRPPRCGLGRGADQAVKVNNTTVWNVDSGLRTSDRTICGLWRTWATLERFLTKDLLISLWNNEDLSETFKAYSALAQYSFHAVALLNSSIWLGLTVTRFCYGKVSCSNIAEYFYGQKINACTTGAWHIRQGNFEILFSLTVRAMLENSETNVMTPRKKSTPSSLTGFLRDWSYFEV